MDKLKIECIPFTKEIGKFISAHHYSQSYSNSVKYCYGLYLDQTLIGVCTFSTFSRNESAKKYSQDIELSRFVLSESLPNVASHFLGGCLRDLKKRDPEIAGVITYADTTEGHQGTIYKAANFKKVGTARPSYHYVDSGGNRFHKRNIWRGSKKQKIPEKEYAQKLGLIRVKEQHKIIYKYELRSLDQIVHGLIYLIENKINKKVYVGKTIQGLERRFKRHKDDAKKGFLTKLHTAIREIGEETFSIKQIDEAFSSKELADKEAYWINHYNSCKAGYNSTEGYDDTHYFVPDEVFYKSLKLRLEGVPVTKIAKQIGVSYDFLVSIQSGRTRPHILQKFEEEHGKLDRPRKMSDLEKLKIFTLYRSGKKPTAIGRELNTSKAYVLKLLNGEIDPEFKKKWELTNPAIDTRRKKKPPIKKPPPEPKVAEEILLEIFKQKAHGVKTKDLAKQYNINLNWINIILRGDARPEVKAKWLATGGALPKKARSLRDSWRVVSENVCFYTPKDAADYLGVSVTAVVKAIKRGHKCKGMLFCYYEEENKPYPRFDQN